MPESLPGIFHRESMVVLVPIPHLRDSDEKSALYHRGLAALRQMIVS